MSVEDTRRILVTAALPYANGPVHIGHLAGAYLPADLFCRYQRLVGKDVAFICGSDEMGVAIMVRARNEGIAPQDLVDRYHPMIRDAFRDFGMSFDFYGRTTSPVHAETSRDFFRVLAAKGAFTTRTEQQLFDPEAGIFLADRFVKGTCPSCGNPEAYGDQCEKCGTSLSPSELVNPRSTLSDATPELRESTHWYLPLGASQEALAQWIGTHPEWKPNVLGQVRSWLADGLRDRAITRDVPWGVPVPEDVALAAGVDAAGKVIYVWFDAPIGYISATKEWTASLGAPEAWKGWWQSEDSRLFHFIGKDNIVFLCLMFPAMLMAHGDFVLPENVPANEFLNIEGKKFSTSRGWAVWLHEYLAEFPPDLLRYALATTLPETKDADFSWSDFQNRVNGELADILGNFVHRTLTFAGRFADGIVPPLVEPSEFDRAVLEELATFPTRVGDAYDAFRFREGVFETMALARLGNKYFNDTEPWHSRKTNPQACANTIHVSLQLCASLAVLLEPVLPFTAAAIRRMLRLEGVAASAPVTGEFADSVPGSVLAGTASAGIGGTIRWADAGRPLLAVGHRLGEPEILFKKVEDETIAVQLAKLQGPAAVGADVSIAVSDLEAAPAPELPFVPAKEHIQYDDFAKLDLRAGTIVAAESLPKSKKLVKLRVDLGYEERQILAGVAEHFKPEDLVGRRVTVVANLAPRVMMGLESQGMLLMAENRDGSLHPITSTGENGSVVK